MRVHEKTGSNLMESKRIPGELTAFLVLVFEIFCSQTTKPYFKYCFFILNFET